MVTPHQPYCEQHWPLGQRATLAPQAPPGWAVGRVGRGLGRGLGLGLGGGLGLGLGGGLGLGLGGGLGLGLGDGLGVVPLPLQVP